MGKKTVKRERQVAPPTCVGCGSAATGYHYGAPSCVPCKTFFRRIVMEGREHSGCLTKGACDRHRYLHPCQTCRLERCMRGGMNPTFTATLKDPGNNPIVRKFRREHDNIQSCSSTASTSSCSLDLVPVPKRFIRGILSGVEEEVPLLIYVFRNHDIENVQSAMPSVIECTIERVIGVLLHLEKAHDALRQSLMSTGVEALQTYAYDTTPLGKPWRPGAWKCWPLADLIFSIEFIKTFECFHCLSHQDKLALCRHVAVICAQLTMAYFSYEKRSDATIYHDGFMPFNGFVPAEFPYDHLELDRKEYVLLKALIICNPAIEGLSMSYKVKLEQEREKYSKSLMSYVLARRGHVKGPVVFTSMMSLVDWLTHLMKRRKNWYVMRKAVAHQQGRERPETIEDDVMFY